MLLHSPPSALAAVRETARSRGCTVTELVVAALASSFAGSAEPDGHNAVTVRLSLDLRPYFAAERRPRFGNYVASFLVHLTRWRDLTTTITDVRAQVRDYVGRFERKEMSYPLLTAELAPRLSVEGCWHTRRALSSDAGGCNRSPFTIPTSATVTRSIASATARN